MDLSIAFLFIFIFFWLVKEWYELKSTWSHSNISFSFFYLHKWNIVQQLDRIIFCFYSSLGIQQKYEINWDKKSEVFTWSITIFLYQIIELNMMWVVYINFDIFREGFVVFVRVKVYWDFIDIVRWTVYIVGCWIFCFWLGFIDWMPCYYSLFYKVTINFSILLLKFCLRNK